MQHERWMEKAYLAAQCSADPSTQNGAVVVGTDGRLATAWNGMVPGLPAQWIHGPDKLLYCQHAEEAALYKAIRRGIRPDVLVSPWAACHRCAREIAGLGVKKLVRHREAMLLTPERWQADCLAGDEILLAAGVQIHEIEGEFGFELRRNGNKVTL